MEAADAIAETDNGPPAPPADWYPDPSGLGQRYWDGAAWTTHYAAYTPASEVAAGEPRAKSGDWIGAFLLPLMVPPVGVIAGIVYVARGDERANVGWVCLGLSLAVIGLYVALAL